MALPFANRKRKFHQIVFTLSLVWFVSCSFMYTLHSIFFFPVWIPISGASNLRRFLPFLFSLYHFSFFLFPSPSFSIYQSQPENYSNSQKLVLSYSSTLLKQREKKMNTAILRSIKSFLHFVN